MGKAQSGVTSDGTGSVQNLCDPVWWHVEPAREFGGAYTQRFEFFSEVFTGMNSRDYHFDDPSDRQRSLRWTARVLLRPIQADPPLLVNANAVLALSVTAQCFKPVAR